MYEKLKLIRENSYLKAGICNLILDLEEKSKEDKNIRNMTTPIRRYLEDLIFYDDAMARTKKRHERLFDLCLDEEEKKDE